MKKNLDSDITQESIIA